MSRQDVVKRKKSDKLIIANGMRRETNEYLESLLNYANAPIIVWNPQYEITRFNKAFETLTGRSEKDILGKSLEILFPPDSRDNSMELIRKTLEGDRMEVVELNILHIDGSVRTLLWNSANIMSTDGKTPIATIAQGHNITRHKQAEEALRESENNYHDLVEQTRDIIFSLSPQGLLISLNQAFEHITGLQIQEWLGKPVLDLLHPEDFSLVSERFSKVLKGYLAEPIELRLRKKSGDYVLCEILASPQIKNEMIIGLQGIIRDITERKRAENALRESEKRLKDIIFSMADWVWEVDENGVYTYSSQKGFDFFGPSHENVIGKTPFDFMPPDEAKRVAAIFSEIAINKAPIKDLENWNIMKNGERICLLTNGVPMIDKAGNLKGYRGVDKDITERRRAEQELIIANKELLFQNEEKEKRAAELKESEEKYRNIFESAAIGIYRTSPEGHILLANPMLINMLGYDTFENLAKRNLEKQGFEPGYERYEFREHIERDGYIIGLETAWQKKDGTTIFIRENAKVYRDGAGNVLYYDGTIEDITERKRAEQELIIANKELLFQNEEKEKRAAELILANKELLFQTEEKEKRAAELIKAIKKAEESDNLKSAFLNNLSHEIRTPMNQILGFASLLKDPELTEVTRDEYIGLINSQSHQLLHIITDIVEISKITAGQVAIKSTSFNLSEMMNELYASFKPKADHRNLQLNLNKKIADSDDLIRGDQVKLNLIFRNLIENAIKYTNVGSVDIEYSRVGDRLIIAVKDTGIGIEEQEKKIIFDHFRQIEISTMRQYGGLGLGLSISKAYIRMMSGVIRVESEPGKGSTFFVEIPFLPAVRVSESTRNVLYTPVISRPDWQDKTLLIVEDEDSNVQYLTAALRITGAHILYAINGIEAVEQCKIHPEIAVVLMDIKMPRMDGLEATKIIKSFRNKLPVIATTAFAMTRDKEYILESGCDDYLPKPSTREDLIVKIQKWMGSSE